ncbi:putative permease subfamily protein [marine gamma proteobacterium HTCC2148]|jgi:AGZA family xanthine/uracil permease-like MFS transporter|nr:putative permease subfamily protein [marine gamma proteobacterium HTCC2148]MBT5007484.1 NCS2 family permease [Halieaceae bacterium]MBT7718262.1 NCS2 family permease [Halieaceae bacterium]
MQALLERLFKLEEHETRVSTEVLAGLTTFITMAYIIFVNPQMMASAGMDLGASFAATCLAAALACVFMGLYANWPVGLAPGMGLNAFFTYTVVGEMGYSWQVALGAVFIAGILFVIMSVTRLRAWMLNSIPKDLRVAMGAGVGLFVGFIGLKSGGLITENPATLLSLGDLTQPEPLMAALGFILIAGLSVRQVPGAIMLGVLAITVLGVLTGMVEYQGLVAAPPSIAPTLMQLDIVGAFEVGMVSVIIAILFVNLFDTAGTLLGVATRANLVTEQGEIQNMDKALQADSSSSVVGALFGCAPVTSYVESAAGVAAGGRTGLTAVTVGILFLLAMFFSPLAGMVPAYATAGALIYVALLMMSGMQGLDYEDATELIPSLLTIIMIPLTFSIANGIAVGFISYVAIKVIAGRFSEVSFGAWFLAVIFLAKFAFF